MQRRRMYFRQEFERMQRIAPDNEIEAVTSTSESAVALIQILTK